MSRRGFDAVIGQELAKRVLLKAVAEGRPAHAYLFAGAAGTGKMTVAMEFTKSLNCERPDENGSCGECAICHSIDHGNFPDISTWNPEGQNTSIEQMRQMRDLARFAPMRGRWKVNIIEQGDTLNDESANCILKLVEEPPAYLVNILLYRNTAAVLPTIRSRCQLVRFPQVSGDELARRMVEDFGTDSARAEFLATFSQGRPGIAIELLSDASFFEKRDRVLRAVQARSSGSPWLALKLASELRPTAAAKAAAETEDDETGDTEPAPAPEPAAPARKQSARQAAAESLDMMLSWYRDLLAASVQGDGAGIVNSDRRIELAAGASMDTAALLDAISEILRTKRNILGNANPQIATEALMARLNAG